MKIFTRRFQSLFFWNHYLDQLRQFQSVQQFLVSILVFLEPLLRPARLKPATATARVSILVFLEPLLRHDRPAENLERVMFQSLFFWNHYLDWIAAPSGWLFCCFNPCFSGTTTQTMSDTKPYMVLVKFQSLFFWNHYLDRQSHAGQPDSGHVSILVFLEPLLRLGNSPVAQVALASFNPCFSGTTTQTVGLAIVKNEEFSFNPCFSGTTTQTRCGFLFVWRLYVSILVFLEPLLRLSFVRRYNRCGGVSILVFLEPLLRLLNQEF